jgi:catechol 2,3-dioxygenase-like lactoylglutathione lyase family enzyme
MIQVSISIDVPDLAKGEAFYVQALGCKTVRRQGDEVLRRRVRGYDYGYLQLWRLRAEV